MRGAIHGIWLVTPGGKLHSAIIPKFSAWTPVAAKADFHVVLWSNIDSLKPEEILRLQDANITIGNPSDFKSSPLYKYYNYFLEKGSTGDTTALALASDIFRMIILDFTADDKYFIYVDPNDVDFIGLENSLQNLDTHMRNNKLGYAFPVGAVTEKTNVFEMRNDVLIALKTKNPKFFKDYLMAYWANLEEIYKSYEKPSTDEQAKLLANRISNSTSTLFFRLESLNDKSIQIFTQFADYSEKCKVIDSNSYLNYFRVISHGNSWLPNGKKFGVRDELAISDSLTENLISAQNKYTKIKLSQQPITSQTNIHGSKFAIIAGSATILAVLLLIILRRKVFRISLIKKI